MVIFLIVENPYSFVLSPIMCVECKLSLVFPKKAKRLRVFDIQEQVSRSIVEALNLKLSAQEELYLSKHLIQNPKGP